MMHADTNGRLMAARRTQMQMPEAQAWTAQGSPRHRGAALAGTVFLPNGGNPMTGSCRRAPAATAGFRAQALPVPGDESGSEPSATSPSRHASASFTTCRFFRDGCRVGTRCCRSTWLNSDPLVSSAPRVTSSAKACEA